ncbi:MAG: hypothetical protein MUC87_15440 [Bacteroidia bacterium]|nr:hypothetical protein [Bacteroidia bacterium]
MELFTAVLRKQLNTTSPNNRICVVFQDFRPVERPALIQAAFEDIDTSGVPIIWSDTLFEQARQKVNQPKGGSLLLVYNQKYQLLYSKAGKSVTGTEPELKNIFN